MTMFTKTQQQLNLDQIAKLEPELSEALGDPVLTEVDALLRKYEKQGGLDGRDALRLHYLAVDGLGMSANAMRFRLDKLMGRDSCGYTLKKHPAGTIPSPTPVFGDTLNV